jgi:Holliday junction DNA helicase RuvA
VIGSLRGTVLDRSPAGEVLVEVGGLGYRVSVAPGTLVGLGDVGAPVFLWVHHHVRDDAVVLYGFTSRQERDCFEALIGAHGVGPALGLAILSVHTPDTLRRCLLDGDADALTLVPGVGKKTAARLLVELKARLDLPDIDIDLVAVGVESRPASARAELHAALAGLGYEADEIAPVLSRLPSEGDLEALLRDALKLLAAAR